MKNSEMNFINCLTDIEFIAGLLKIDKSGKIIILIFDYIQSKLIINSEYSMMKIFLINALFFLMVSGVSLISQLNLLSNGSYEALRPFFNQNPAVKAVLANNYFLDQDTQFVPLMKFIISNQTVFQITLANLSNNHAFFWAKNMSMSELRQFIDSAINSTSNLQSLPTLYRIFFQLLYLISEKQCQSTLKMVVSTNNKIAISNILAPLKGSYFWNKRCTLSMSPNLLPITDLRINQLTFNQKLLLVPVLNRLGVVCSIIFKNM